MKPALKRLGSSTGPVVLAIVLVAAGSAAAGQLITGRQVQNGTLTLKDFKPSERKKLIGPKGARGPAGERGPAGPTGPTGQLGAAGGDLTGSYPDPLIAANAVGSAEVTDGSLGAADIGSIGQAELGTGGSAPVDIPSIAGFGCSTFSFFIPGGGGSVGDIGFVVPDNGTIGDSGSPLTIDIGRVTPSPGYVTAHVCNVSGSAFDPPEESFRIFTIRP